MSGLHIGNQVMNHLGGATCCHEHDSPPNSDLHVIAVIQNPVRYRARYELYQQFAKEMEAAGVDLWTVELSFGERGKAVTKNERTRQVHVKTLDELWHKENLINYGISCLPEDWKYVAWIDADVTFQRPDWVQETLQQLQHYHVVQMWETCVDLGPHGQVLSTHHSFISQYLKGKPYAYKGEGGYYEMWHPGFAWAASREAIDHLGGLLDTAILGAGDNHMAHALVGMVDKTLAKGLHPNYAKHLNIWQTRAERNIRRDVGCVPGTILHHWHGKKVDRRYHDRWQILVQHQFDPDWDLKKDSQGILQLVDHGDVRSIGLRDALRRYFRLRNEDSIDI